MQLMLPALDSLRRKIVFAYGAIAALVVALSAFSVIEMRLLEAQIASGERIGQFLGIALELRRFEKNYFLYRQSVDLDETHAYVAQARRLLTEHAGDFVAFETTDRNIDTLRAALDTYDALVAPSAPGTADPLLEARIRQAGKQIVTIAENWARAERALLQGQLERHRFWLLGAIVAVAAAVLLVGQLLAWRVARPLRRLERDMAAVAAGRLTRLDLHADDREIASLTVAFNRVLRELDLRQGQLVRSEKLAALGTLLSGVAHELNNPLSNISTSCEILKEEAKVGAGRTAFEQEMLDQIDAETWRARRIVRSLLDYARDRSFRREPVALDALVEESLRLVKARIPAQVAVAVAIPPGLTLAGDKQRLQQALFNLIGNAIDALEGAGRLSIAARRAAAPLPPDAPDVLVCGPRPGDGPVIEIEVQDDGAGIPADVLPRIFDPFFTTKEVGHGLGLGLFIVFEIVEEHGGCIAVQSAPGRGTTFLLRFPEKISQ
jgi:signal transduction histidine kinase